MRTSFHHQPEAQHPIFQLSTSWQADYPIFRSKADMDEQSRSGSSVANDPERPLSANLFCTAKIYSFDQFVRAQ